MKKNEAVWVTHCKGLNSVMEERDTALPCQHSDAPQSVEYSYTPMKKTGLKLSDSDALR